MREGALIAQLLQKVARYRLESLKILIAHL
jgi:hypothetical protein